MEDAFESLGAGVRAVVADPGLVGATALVCAVLVPVLGFLGVVGVVATLIVVGPLLFRFGTATLVKPLLLGGLVGRADAGLDGDGSLGDVVAALNDRRGISLAFAYGLQEMLLAAAGVALVVLYYAGRFAGEAVAVPYTALQYWTGGVTLVGAAIYVVVAATLQFVDVAAVLDDATATDALRRSYAMTRERPGEVSGYTVLRVLLVGVAALPGVVILAAESSTAGSPSAFELVGWATTLLLVPVGLAAAVATHVAYYRRRRPARR